MLQERKQTRTHLMIDGLPVLMTRKSIKNIYLKVDAQTGEICVNAPFGSPVSQIEALVRRHRSWIEKRLADISAGKTSRPSLQTPDRTALWGEPFELRTVPQPGKAAPQFDGHLLLLPVPPDASSEQIQKRLNDWYRKQLAEALPAMIRKTEAHSGLHAAEYRIRDMKSCWGTCHSRDQRIYLNLKLVKYPPRCLEYVLYHEQTHLSIPHHGPDFWSQVSVFCPNWKEIRKELNAL